MIRHLLKLVWRRKRTNGLIILEIFFSFLVVFLVVTFGLYLLDNYRRPLGFSYDGVWDIDVDMGATGDDRTSAPQVETAARLLRELESMDEIEASAGAECAPYDGSVSQGNWQTEDGRTVRVQVNEVTDGLAEVLGLDVVRGRWFEESDGAMDWRAVVINERLAGELYGSEDPIGQRLPFGREENTRVVGMVSDFRKEGELSTAVNYLFRRKRMGDTSERPPQAYMIKLRPGVGPAFEEELAKRVQSIGRDWSFEIRSMDRMRESYLRLRLAPLIAGGVVAVFLMLMVGLGLIGVLWQNVTQRTREIGLRRAAGATGGQVRRQVLMELGIITTLGLLLGVLVVVQLPILDLMGFVASGVFAASLLLSATLIYLMAILCGLYPSWLATRVQPAEALHYE